MVELPWMQRHYIERKPRTQVAQACCTAGKRCNKCAFACVNEPICVPTLLSGPAQKRPFTHAKGCYAFSLQKLSTCRTCNLRTQKGVFASPVQSVQSRNRRLLHTQEWGKTKENKESPTPSPSNHHLSSTPPPSNHHLSPPTQCRSTNPSVHFTGPPIRVTNGPPVSETTATRSRESGARLALSSECSAARGCLRPRTSAAAGPGQLQRTEGAQTPCRLA